MDYGKSNNSLTSHRKLGFQCTTGTIWSITVRYCVMYCILWWEPQEEQLLHEQQLMGIQRNKQTIRVDTACPNISKAFAWCQQPNTPHHDWARVPHGTLFLKQCTAFDQSSMSIVPDPIPGDQGRCSGSVKNAKSDVQSRCIQPAVCIAWGFALKKITLFLLL